MARGRTARRGKPRGRVRPIALSKLLGVSARRFDAAGIFDAVLNVDTQLFIDPVLLKGAQEVEFRDSYTKLKARFRDLLLLLEHTGGEGDSFWRRADRLLRFPEVQGLCIGYSARGTAGSGSGSAIRKEMLRTAHAMVVAGRKDPAIFEIMGLFQPRFGPDRISDMTAGILIDDLRAYTRRVLSDIGAATAVPMRPLEWSEGLPMNPYNGKPIVLAPWEILDELPVALDPRSYRERVAFGEADAIRERASAVVREAWLEELADLAKEDRRDRVLADPRLIDELIRRYDRTRARRYNFERDPAGHLAWNRDGSEIARAHPLTLTLPENPTNTEIASVVATICAHFKRVVENNGVWSVLYDRDRQPHHEKFAQRVFFCIADAYCAASNIDLSPETNSGRGSVDFKLSKGYAVRAVVEVKLTTNSKLNHGLTRQLPEYGKAEQTAERTYLVVDVGAPRKRIDRFQKIVHDLGARAPTVVWVDGRPRESASRR